MRVFIVDNSKAFREELISHLSKLKEVEIVGQAKAPPEAIKAIRKFKPDAVILDIQLAGGSGIDVLKKIKKDNPNLKVIVLTNYPYRQYRKKCIDLGADFFFDKSSEFAKLIEILRDIVKKVSK